MLQFLTGIKLDQVLLLLKWLGISFLVAAIILMTREHLSTKREIEKLKTTNEELKKDLADKDKDIKEIAVYNEETKKIIRGRGKRANEISRLEAKRDKAGNITSGDPILHKLNGMFDK